MELESLKSLVMVVVTLSLIFSSIFILLLLRANAGDVITPIATSVFTSGLLVGFCCMLACFINWFDIKHYQYVLYIFIYSFITSLSSNAVFVSILASLKLFAVWKPFMFKRSVTFKKLKSITICIWGIDVFLISPIMAYLSSAKYDSVMKLVIIDDKSATGYYVLTFARMLYIVSTSVSIFTGVGFFIAVVRHAIRMKTHRALPVAERDQQQQQQQQQQEKQQRQEVLAAISEYKGVLVITFTRLVLNMPYQLVWMKQYQLTKYHFFGMWAVMGTFVLDALGYVLFSKKLRKVVWKIVTCNKCRNTENPIQLN